MKRTKRIAAMFLAVVMMLAMSLTAFAAQTGNLTIKGTTEGKQYDLYRVFDLTQDGDAYSYTVTEQFNSFFVEESVTDPVAYVKTLDADGVSALAQKALAWAIENNVQVDMSVTGEADQTTVSGIPYGYYLLNPLGGNDAKEGYATMFSMSTVGSTDTEIEIKAEYPTLDKVIVEDDGDKKTDEASIGDTVSFKLTSKVPDMTGYNRYYFVIEDTMSEGLDYVGNETITIGAATLVKDTDYTVEQNGQTIRIIFKDFLKYAAQTGDAVTVKYDVKLNDKAVIGGSNQNNANLIYSDDPKFDYDGGKDPENPDDPSKDPDAPTGETPESHTETYMTSLTLKKVDASGNTLTGAAFRITGDGVNMVVTTGDVYVVNDAEGTFYKLKDGTYTETEPTEGTASDYEDITVKYKKETKVTIDTNGETPVNAEAFVDANGQLTFAGLGAGTYTISEIVVPNGYNKINDFQVVVTFNNDTKTFGATCTAGDVTVANNVISMNVVNQSGTELPSTGGMGRTIIYVTGALLAVGAGIVLITKKRMNSQY